MKEIRKDRIQQRKEKEKDLRRKQIIKAAEKLFLAQGFNNTTMEDIAFEAALSKGAVYYYFESKDDLYLVIGTRAFKKLNDLIEKGISELEAGFEKLLSVGEIVYIYSQKYPEDYKISVEIRSNPSYLSIFKKEVSKEPLSHSEREMINEVNRYKNIFSGVIREAITNKSIRSDIPVLLIGSTLVALTGGLINELSNLQFFFEFIGINPDDIIALVFKWIRKGLELKGDEVQ